MYPREIKKQKYSEKTPDKNILEQYNELIKHCYQLEKSKESYLLSDDARNLFVLYANNNTDLVNGSSNNFFRATYAKMEIQVLRIALIIQLVRGVYNSDEWQQREISKEAIQYAIDICHYFNANILRVENAGEEKNVSSGEAIRIIQQEYGIKNKQAFADSIGVSRQYISKICNQ